jgi:hypothetical protein
MAAILAGRPHGDTHASHHAKAHMELMGLEFFARAIGGS